VFTDVCQAYARSSGTPGAQYSFPLHCRSLTSDSKPREPVSIYMLPSSAEQRPRPPIDRLLEALGSRWNPYPFMILEAPVHQVKSRLARGFAPMDLGTAKKSTALTGTLLEDGDENAFSR
jgi:hypothetical protein